MGPGDGGELAVTLGRRRTHCRVRHRRCVAILSLLWDEWPPVWVGGTGWRVRVGCSCSEVLLLTALCPCVEETHCFVSSADGAK